MRRKSRLDARALAMALGTTLAIASQTARASCEVTVTIGVCTLGWLTGDDFWDGTYSVSYGHGVMTMNGQPVPFAFGGGDAATIDQTGTYLSINAPQRFLQASASEVSLNTPEWRWDQQAADWFGNRDAEELSSMNVGVAMWSSQQCTNQELPRWSAPTRSADNRPMTLDLVGIMPTTIMGMLHAEASQSGVSMRWMLEVTFTRDDFPRSELGTQTINDDAVCNQVCGGGSDWVRYDDGYVWCAR